MLNPSNHRCSDRFSLGHQRKANRRQRLEVAEGDGFPGMLLFMGVRLRFCMHRVYRRDEQMRSLGNDISVILHIRILSLNLRSALHDTTVVTPP